MSAYACAECGTTTATTYVVTTLDPDDSSTRTEVCRWCDNLLRAGGPGDVTFRHDTLNDAERTDDDLSERMWLLRDGVEVAYQDFSYQDADYPDPCSWGELADAQGDLAERVQAELLVDYYAEADA